MFQFKQFIVDDDRCAMKVGTDGVLLGAWAEVADARRVMDVGTGCGLVALMLAQRFPDAVITAIEKDVAAAEQAFENVQRSAFACRVRVEQGNFLEYTDAPFDAIVSNPPFFEEDLLPPDSSRASARHTATGLTFDALISKSVTLLRARGTLQVIIPKDAQARFHALCNSSGLTLVRTTDVRTVQRKAPKRVLLHFIKGSGSTSAVQRDELVLMADGRRTPQYADLCRDFYL